MLKREELENIIEKYKLSHIQSEDDVSGKFIISLSEWLGYPSQFRAQQFPVYGNAGRTPLNAKPADFIFFSDANFDINRTREQEQLDWVKNHSLLIIEAKKPGEMPNVYSQAQFYAYWTQAVAYMYIDGEHIIGFFLSNRTADIRILDFDILSLANNSDLLQFSYDNIRNIKERGLEHIATLTPIQYKEKVSRLHGQNIPDNTGISLIPRYIVPYDNVTRDNTNDNVPSPFDCLEQEKYIVLIAGAGQGKTYTLYQIYREAETHGYHPFFYNLQSLDEGNVLYRIAQDSVEIDENIAFVLDGFDEMSEDKKTLFISMVETTRILYPQILIIISSRENMYSKQLKSAHLFMIKNATDDEIEAYLSCNGIDITQWSAETKKKDLNNIKENMFYLSALKDIWKQEGSLPNKTELMKELIDMRIKQDTDHVYTQSLKQKHKQADTREAFRQVALIMQCMHKYYLSSEEVNNLLTPEMWSIMAIHGLWTSTEAGLWHFAHNNYREYLAAEFLSRMGLERVLGFITSDPDRKTIRPTWINTLSYLTNISRSDELKNWIYSNQIELISLFERDRFTKEQLSGIMQDILNNSKKERTWIDTYDSHINDLVVMCSTPEIVQYIIDELQQEQTERHKHNLLRVLDCIPTFYESKNTVKAIVSDIAFNESIDLFVRCDAFRIMSHHHKVFEEYLDKAAELEKNQESEFLLYEIICFIRESGKAETYIDAVVDAYDKYDYYNNHLISLKTTTYSILENIQEVETACKVLSWCNKWGSKQSKRKEDSINLFRTCCDIGIRFYDGPKNQFLNTLLSMLQKKIRLLDYDFFATLKNYIEKTHTEPLFLDCIITYQPLTHRGYILSQLISDSMMKEINNKVASKSIDINTVKDIIYRLPYKSKYQSSLISAVFLNTNEKIIVNAPRDYTKEQQEGRQRFFDSLFDEKIFDELVNELINILGKDAKICADSYQTLYSETKMEHVREELYACYFALRDLTQASRGMYIREYRTHIKDWNMFCFCNAEHCIENYHVDISENQRKYLVDYCVQCLTNIDLEKKVRVKDRTLVFPIYLLAATKLFGLLSVQCPEKIATKLLILPPYFFEEKNHDQLPECIIKQIRPNVLRKYVINLIHKKKWNRFTAPGLIRYCKDNKITECRAEITEYILNIDVNDGYPYSALDYLEELYGVGVIISDVLPCYENKDILSALAARIPGDLPTLLLDQKLWEAYREKKESRWLIALINHNNEDALREYYKQAKNLMSLPDMTEEPCISEVTDSIRNITSSSCISVLIDLFILACDPKFIDRDDFGLKYSCWGALKTIARKDYEKTRNALLDVTTDEDTTVNTSLRDLLNEINGERKYVQDEPLDYEFAKLLVMNL